MFHRWFRSKFKAWRESQFKVTGRMPSQDDFATHLEMMGRSSINQYLKGKTVPSEGEIWKILIKTKSNLADDLEDVDDQQHWRHDMLIAAKLLRRGDGYTEDLKDYMQFLQYRIEKADSAPKAKTRKGKPPPIK